MVPKFLRSLLSSSKKEQDSFYARQIPLGVFKTHQAELKWLTNYREEYKRYPSVSRFKRRFPNTPLPRSKDTLEELVQEVIDYDILKQLTGAVENSRNLYSSGELNIRDVVSSLRSQISDIHLFDTAYTDLNLGDSSFTQRKYAQKVKRFSENLSSLEFSPWPFLNSLIGVNEPGELFTVASRTSIGKTWLSVFWANHQNFMGERVLFITKEMPTDQIQDRFDALHYRLNYHDFRTGNLKPKELARFNRMTLEKSASSDRSQLIISGHETLKGVGFSHIISKIQQYLPSVLWIDGAYLLLPEGLGRNASMAERIQAISSTIKRMAMHFKLKAYMSIQAKRESENKEGETDSKLKDLFGGDAWAQDSDTVLIVNGRRGSATRRICVAKSRESQIGEFNTAFQLDPFPRFSQVGVNATSSNTGYIEFKGI